MTVERITLQNICIKDGLKNLQPPIRLACFLTFKQRGQ